MRASKKLAFGLSIDWRNLTVTRGKKSLALSRVPLLLIECLAQAGKDIVSESDLQKHAYESIRGDNAIPVNIYRLRKIIGELGVQIENKRDEGYRLVEEGKA